MSNALESFCLMLDVSIPWAVELSVLKGLPSGGCGCPSSIAAMRMGQAALPPMYIPPVSTSTADDITRLMVWHMTWKGALSICCFTFGSFPRKKCTAPLLRALGSTRSCTR